jgi:hypothetical protein
MLLVAIKFLLQELTILMMLQSWALRTFFKHFKLEEFNLNTPLLQPVIKRSSPIHSRQSTSQHGRQHNVSQINYNENIEPTLEPTNGTFLVKMSQIPTLFGYKPTANRIPSLFHLTQCCTLLCVSVAALKNSDSGYHM